MLKKVYINKVCKYTANTHKMQHFIVDFSIHDDWYRTCLECQVNEEPISNCHQLGKWRWEVITGISVIVTEPPDFPLMAINFLLKALNLLFVVLYLFRVMLPQCFHLFLLLLPASGKRTLSTSCGKSLFPVMTCISPEVPFLLRYFPLPKCAPGRPHRASPSTSFPCSFAHLSQLE